ncbi:MAG: SPW repeat protein [Burkholderiaceae bacterium]|nr:SPW repeat protein [Burkholderiaceae bacterium]
MSNSSRHWQDPVNLILGILSLISPWVLSYSTAGRATDNAVLLGILIGIFAIAAMVNLRAWKEWVNVILGAWLFISPWVLGFVGTSIAAAWSAWVLGAIVFILALWELGSDRSIGGWWSHATTQ